MDALQRMSSYSAPDREPLILIVDDIPRNLQVLGSILGDNGYSVNVASNGQGALDVISAQPPDLILLDVQMPDIDGMEICKRLKADPATSAIPVMFLTARTETDDIVRGFETGAVDYITKPFVATELLARVRTHLKIKQYSDLISSQNQSLQALSNEKSELLSVVAHDLKSPLTNVHLIAEMFERKSDVITPERIREYADDLRQSSDRMLALINNILNIHAIETGNYPLSIDRVDATPLVERAVSEYHLQAKRKQIAIELALLPDIALYADPMALLQVLTNLLSNAIKYSPQQTTIRVRMEIGEQKSTEGASKLARIFVQDEGPGISVEDQQRLFQKFARLAARPTGGESSTGLGLSIVKRLAEAMGGDVRCESTLGKGTTFWVEIPVMAE
jgi:signal transduction histidine kinase